MSEFKPEELSVKVLSDRLVVEAEREESKQMDGESGRCYCQLFLFLSEG